MDALLAVFLNLILSLVTPCPTEDSAGPCNWNAAEQGNGTGQSFIVLPAGDPVDNDDDIRIDVGIPLPTLIDVGR